MPTESLFFSFLAEGKPLSRQAQLEKLFLKRIDNRNCPVDENGVQSIMTALQEEYRLAVSGYRAVVETLSAAMLCFGRRQADSDRLWDRDAWKQAFGSSTFKSSLTPWDVTCLRYRIAVSRRVSMPLLSLLHPLLPSLNQLMAAARAATESVADAPQSRSDCHRAAVACSEDDFERCCDDFNRFLHARIPFDVLVVRAETDIARDCRAYLDAVPDADVVSDNEIRRAVKALDAQENSCDPVSAIAVNVARHRAQRVAATATSPRPTPQHAMALLNVLLDKAHYSREARDRDVALSVLQRTAMRLPLQPGAQSRWRSLQLDPDEPVSAQSQAPTPS